VFRAGLLAVATAAIGVLVLRWLASSLIFQPSTGVDLTPERLGLHAEEVRLRTEDGVRIHGWWLPAPGASRGILFLPGNAGNASHRLPNAAQLVRLGAHVLLLDYRGYGLSEGRPDEGGVYADARAGLDHLTGDRGLPAQRVVLFGRSLGGAVAVDLARGRELGGVILESTFTSVSDMATPAFGLPVGGLVRGMFDSGAKIPELRAPLLMLHGDRDRLVPIEMGRKLYSAAPDPKAFWVIRGAGHNDTVAIGGPAYFERLGSFLDEFVADGRRVERTDLWQASPRSTRQLD
jgi:fermentation-respiration switch protein FrsA (DUF1100 family)